MSAGGIGGHPFHNLYSSFPFDATHQIWSRTAQQFMKRSRKCPEDTPLKSRPPANRDGRKQTQEAIYRSSERLR